MQPPGNIRRCYTIRRQGGARDAVDLLGAVVPIAPVLARLDEVALAAAVLQDPRDFDRIALGRQARCLNVQEGDHCRAPWRSGARRSGKKARYARIWSSRTGRKSQ